MHVAWFSDTFEQNNGVSVYLHETLPLLSKKISVKLYTGRVLHPYPYPVQTLPHLEDPLLPDYDIVLPPGDPIPADVVHAHSQYTLGVYAARFPGPRVITAHFVPYHFLEFFFGSKQPEFLSDYVWKYETWLLNQFNRVICQTHAGAKLFKKEGLTSRVEVIANGINLEKYKRVSGARFRKKYGFRKPFALFIGRLDASKRPEWILQTAGNLPELDFLISGKGLMEDELRKQAPSNVKFLGKLPREDLLDCYAAASVLLMPSAIETEGLVAQEAMACGTPVFISDLDVLREVVGKAGIVCRSFEEMAEKLAQFMDQKRKQKELHALALQEIKKRDISLSIEKLVKLYRNLV